MQTYGPGCCGRTIDGSPARILAQMIANKSLSPKMPLGRRIGNRYSFCRSVKSCITPVGFGEPLSSLVPTTCRLHRHAGALASIYPPKSI